MVNFPSRPNLRPVDPPPSGASVRHNCSLPLPAPRPRAGWGRPRHHFSLLVRPEIRDAKSETRYPNQAKNPSNRA